MFVHLANYLFDKIFHIKENDVIINENHRNLINTAQKLANFHYMKDNGTTFTASFTAS